MFSKGVRRVADNAQFSMINAQWRAEKPITSIVYYKQQEIHFSNN